MMQWIVVVLGFFLLLGAESQRKHHKMCECTRVADEFERKRRLMRRQMKDRWIRFQGVVAGEEVVL